DLENLVVGVVNQAPIYLKQVAKVVDGPEIQVEYVTFGLSDQQAAKMGGSTKEFPAVTISVAKRKGADAMLIAGKVIEKVDLLKSDLIPSDIHVEVTRNYGETASQKV